MDKTRRFLMIGGVVAFLALIFGQTAAALYTDWLWFESLDFSLLFTRIFNIQALLGLVFGLVSGLLFYLNGVFAQRWGGPAVLGSGEYLQFSAMDRLSGKIPYLLKGASVLM